MTPDEMQTDILMKEYAAMREEVLLHFKNAKLHLRHFQAFIGAGLVIIWYLFLFAKPDRVQAVVNAIGINKGDLILYIIFGLDIISYYFAFDILDSYFCIFLAGARLANIEQQINNKWGKTLLIWESKFQSEKVALLGSSRISITGYQVVLVMVVSLIIPLICYYILSKSSDLKYPAVICLAAGSCVALFIWFIYAFIDVFVFRRKRARRVIDEIVADKT